MSLRKNNRNENNKVKKLTGDQPKLLKHPRLLKSLGLFDIRRQFGEDSLLVQKGIFIYEY